MADSKKQKIRLLCKKNTKKTCLSKMTSATLIGREPVNTGTDVNNILRGSCRASSSSLQKSSKQRSVNYARLKKYLLHFTKVATAPQKEVRKEIEINSNNKTKYNTVPNPIGRHQLKIEKYQADPCQINRKGTSYKFGRPSGSKNVKTEYLFAITQTEIVSTDPQNEVRKEIEINSNNKTKYNTAPNPIGHHQLKIEKYQTDPCQINRKGTRYKSSRLSG